MSTTRLDDTQTDRQNDARTDTRTDAPADRAGHVVFAPLPAAADDTPAADDTAERARAVEDSRTGLDVAWRRWANAMAMDPLPTLNLAAPRVYLVSDDSGDARWVALVKFYFVFDGVWYHGHSKGCGDRTVFTVFRTKIDPSPVAAPPRRRWFQRRWASA